MNPVIEKGIIRFRNHVETGASNNVVLNIHCAGNKLSTKGEGSSFSVIGEGYLRDSSCDISGINNHVLVGSSSAVSSSSSIRIIGNNNIIDIAENCKLIACSIYIVGDRNRIVISGNVSAVYTSFHMEGDDNSVEIGKTTSLHGRENGNLEFSLEESTSIVVKENCMISNGVSIRSSDSHSILNEKGKRINPAGDIVIENHVWICMRSLILKNTVIHKNCIVGAGSICNKDYGKDGCLIAGNPAKIVRENVSWSRDRL